MREADFERDAPGLFETIPGGKAFVPRLLPPHLTLPTVTQRLLDEATHAVGTINGTARGLPNPNLIIQPFVRREAVLSSKIEGTVASFSDLVLFEADPKTARRDAGEVYNYVKALQSAVEKTKKLPVGLRLIRETHAELTEGITREGYAYPGLIRTSQVYIGNRSQGIARARFVPPPPNQLATLLDNFERYINAGNDDNTPLLVRLAIAHYQFETIHPFMDGNGRVGRLLMTLLLCSAGRLCVPVLYLSAFFSSYKQKYYDLLLKVSQKNAWIEWIDFFLTGVIETANDAIARAGKLLDLHNRYRQLLISKGCGDVAQQVLDILFEYPAYSIAQAARALHRTYPTVQLATEKLVANDIVHLYPESTKPKLYLSRAIIDILEDTTLLTEEELPTEAAS